MIKKTRFKLRIRNGTIACAAKIQGLKGGHVLRMALDTGATITMISPESAESIGVHPARAHKTKEIMTGSGSIVCPIVTIPKFISLGHAIRNLEVFCHTLPEGSPVDGLLGLTFLAHFDRRLNFREAFLEIR